MPAMGGLPDTAFARDGVAVVPSDFAGVRLVALAARVDGLVGGGAGARHFSVDADLAELIAADGPMAALATRLMERPMRAVRLLFFDKTARANWAVPWHQDRAIAVRRRLDVEGYGSWSIKRGVVHVEPPADVLAGMVALRLHVDACPADNGALEVVPGSWKLGRLPAAQVERKVAAAAACGGIAICAADAGAIVAMRGLTLHASKPARTPWHRRVVHVDFADRDLAGGLEWQLDPREP